MAITVVQTGESTKSVPQKVKGSISSIVNEARRDEQTFSHLDLNDIFDGITKIGNLINSQALLNGELIIARYYYVGITGNYEERLGYHRVTENFIVIEADKEKNAREIERFYTNYRGNKGNG